MMRAIPLFYSASLAVLGTLMAGPVLAQTTPAGQAPVVIKGKTPTVINKVDRKVYKADGDLQSSTGSAADMLNNIPSVEVDPDGNISLRGDSSVTVLIDGKPSSQLQGASRGATLQSLSGSDIQQIEVITSPSAEFKPDGSGGVINIVTRKTRKKGASGLVQVNAGNMGRANGNLTGSYATNLFTLSGGLSIRNDMRPRDTDSHTVSTGAGTAGSTVSHQHQRESSSRKVGNVAIELTPNDTQTFGLSADYMSRDERGESLEQSSSSAGAAYSRYRRGGGPRSNADIAASFEQKGARDGETFTVNAQTGYSAEKNVYNYTTDYASAGSPSTREQDFGREAYGVSELTLGYVRPMLSGATLKLGYDAEYDQNGFDNTVARAGWPAAGLSIDHAFDNHFRYRQVIHAVYATYDRKWGKLELLGGLRGEQTDVRTVQQVSGDSSTQSYATLYPTVNLNYDLSDNDTLTAGFSKRVRRRDPEDLNPYINASDPNNLRQGNPALKPEMTNSLEVGYRHSAGGQSYSLTGYYRKSRNGDSEVLTVISSDVVLIREANLPSSRSGGVEFTASGKLLPKLSYTLSGNAFYNEVNALALGAGTRSTIGLTTKASLDYQPTTADRWQVGVNANGKRLTAQGYVLPVTTMNIGYRHQVDDRIAMVATVSDLFNSQRQKRLFITPTYTGTYERHQGGQIAYIGISYLLGATKKAKDADFSYEQ